MSEVAKPYAMLAEFHTTAEVLHAAEKVRDAGFRRAGGRGGGANRLGGPRSIRHPGRSADAQAAGAR